METAQANLALNFNIALLLALALPIILAAKPLWARISRHNAAPARGAAGAASQKSDGALLSHSEVWVE